MADSCYTLIPADDKSEQPTLAQLKTQLETGDEEMKIQTMKKILTMMLNGEPLPQLLMFVIRFVVPSKNKTLKKLLLLYWEVSQKKNPDGKLKQEFILVCNALRNDLQHPNEYIRGTTLRFICKLREPEILEPLVPSIRACLEHRHTYVRRNAILSIFSIYKHMDYLMPDAPDVIYNYLLSESDMSCKRNAFIMLYNCDQGRAVEFLSSVIDQVVNYGESLQLTIIDLIRKVWKTSPSEKPKFLRCIYELLNSSSSAVKYESASVLTSLSSAPTSIKAAAACYINLIVKESDNNVKLIVLDRISELREKHGRVLDDQVMDVLRVLASPDIEVRKKCLKISLEMVSSKNVSEVVSFLKKEISKTHDQDYEKNAEYRQLLIQSIHSCAIKFSEVAGSVVHTLMEFISDSNVDSAVEVIKFVKEVVERFPNLRKSLTDKLVECLNDIKDSRVYSGSLWVLGEYCSDEESIEECFEAIRRILGEVPIVEHELKNAQAIAEKMKEEAAPVTSGTLSAPVSRVVVLPDGTYSTQSALSNESALSKQLQVSKKTRPLRSLLLEGDFYLADIFSSSITKLALKYASCCKDHVKVNKLNSEVMLTLTSILRLGKSEIVQNPIDPDSYERIVGCLRALMEPSSITTENFLSLSRQSFTNLLESRKSESIKKDEVASRVIHAEESIYFRHLKAKKNEEIEDQHEVDLNKATGAGESDDLLSKLSRIVQLTGHSDPVYAEAYVNVHQYDILLDVLIVNQTTDTLQNLSLELATLGDLKLTERPSLHNLGPHDFLNIKANIKVSSTETGVIFGNIVYDRSGSVDSNVIIMNDIHIDIMDYIQPAYCEEKQFLDMWSEFEWENKVNVVTTIEDLRDYLNHILKMTNMSSLTPKSALEGDCAFLSANLYARSIFGEDALANISIEKTTQGKIVGHIRIRSKTQGIALSLGEKINQTQRSLPEQ